MFFDFLSLAFRNITQRKRRTWLTVIGIFIGIAAVVALVSLGQGLNQSITNEFQSIGSDKLFIRPGGSTGPGGSSTAGTAVELTEDDLRTVERTRGVAQTVGILSVSAQVTYSDETTFIPIIGAPTDQGLQLLKESWEIEMEDGRLIRSTDRSNIVLGSNVADNVFDEKVSIRNKFKFRGSEYRIVGIMESTGDPGLDSAIIIPLEVTREIFDQEDKVSQIIVRTQEGFDPIGVKENIERNLRQERNLDEGEEDFTISTPQDILDSLTSILNLVQAITVGIASISLLVGGVGIMNTMYTSVTERTREIGIMKAIGARNSHILTIFILESGIIGLIGGIIGVSLGIGLSQTAVYFGRMYTDIPINASLSPVLILGSLAFAFLIGTISGVFPARKASKMEPADALRYE